MTSLDGNNRRLDSSQTARRTGLLIRIWRRRVSFIVVFCAIMAVTLTAIFVVPVRYLATGSVIVAEQEPAAPGSSAASVAWVQKMGDPADLESQLQVILSPRLLRLAMAAPGALEAVLEECRYNEHGVFSFLLGSQCDKLKPDSDAVIEYVGTRYRIGSVGRSRVISISYLSPLPSVAQKLANVLVTAFLDDQRASLSTGREAAAVWLRQELRRVDAELRDQDAAIQAFRRAKGLTRGATAPITSERLTSMSRQLSAAEAERAAAAARIQEIETNPSHAAAVLASRTVADLKQQMSAVSTQLANSAAVLGPNHPTLRAQQRERDVLDQRVAAEIANIAASAKKTYEAADMLVASLKQQMEVLKAEFAAATSDEISIESMVRSAEIKRQEYAELYKRASELESERRLLVGSSRLVSLAEYPAKPFFPRPIPFLAGGFVIANLLAFAAALSRDRSDRSVRASQELAEMTGAPIVAHLPQLTNGRSAHGLGSFLNHSDVPLAKALKDAKRDPVLQDALRKLYAGLVLAGGPDKLRTVLVTSAGSREGKTFTSLALAQFVAEAGHRVLVVECDLRCPAFATALGLPSARGLADVLRGELPVRDAIVRTAVPTLHVIPAGRPTKDSTELLMGRHLPELLQCAQLYDLVLLDSPPSALMMDACMLAKHVDGVLCCTRWGYSSLADSAATIDHIRAAGGAVFGTAMTMVNADDLALYESTPKPVLAYLGAG